MTFYTDVILKSPWSQRALAGSVCTEMAMLEPGFRNKIAAFIVDAARGGHTLKVLETFRSQARQQKLYAQGRTAPGQIVTDLETVGVHGYGLAVDLGLMNPKYDGVGEHYRFFTLIAAKHGLISGIDWGTPKAKHTFRDWDHIQGVPIFRQKALFAGQWYPGTGYDPIQDEIDHHVAGI